MLQAIVVRRLLILGVTVLGTTILPWVLQSRPALAWTWDKVGPRVVERATDVIETKFPGPLPKGDPDFTPMPPDVNIPVPPVPDEKNPSPLPPLSPPEDSLVARTAKYAVGLAKVLVKIALGG